MKTTTLCFEEGTWQGSTTGLANAQLVLVFGSGEKICDPTVRNQLRAISPAAELVGCSTAGEISGSSVSDEGVVALVIEFASTRVRAVSSPIPDAGSSDGVGRQLATELLADDLRHVLVFSEGLNIDGAALADGLRAMLPAHVSATGGLAGDGPRFEKTFVMHNDSVASNQVVAVGLYGPDLEVSWGSAGGWSAFGPQRVVTRAQGNVLFELDGKPALALYKTYLGDRAEGLPATGLLFPLELLPEHEGEPPLVRTILAVDEVAQSLTFAGHVPTGRQVRLAKFTIDRIIHAAEEAGEDSKLSSCPELVLVVSCVGRRMLLDQRVEEEIEVVLTELGNPQQVGGFYSYGEIGPLGFSHGCALHNQTLTFTTFNERSGVAPSS